ncbi:MAG: fatty acid desaturase [Myxococcota bacterium]
MNDIVIRDPGESTKPLGPIARWATRFIRDPRDLPFLGVTVSALAIVLPMAVLLYIPSLFSGWLAAAYLAVVFLGFVDRYILMLHCTSHRKLFVPGLAAFDHIIPAVLGPFMGQSPYTYFAHHVGMHHRENNLAADLSSTMRYRRDSARGFMAYFLSFFFGGIFQLTRYHWKRGRTKLFRMALLGELSWYALVIGLAFLNLPATLIVFIVPFVLVRFLMMAGNWVQHAFIDASAPESPYKNSLTCINTRYNRRCFNDGYHIGHHIKATRHWTELPGEFRDNLAAYRDEGAIVFDGVDFFQIWVLLMFKRHKSLASRFVDLRDERRSESEILALLHQRLEPIHTTQVA